MGEGITLRVDAGADAGPFTPFWEATGFADAACLERPDYLQQLRLAGSIPRRGIRHVRIHSLLDLVYAPGLGGDAQGFDGSRLFVGIDALRERGLQPFFEVMGNPGGGFKDFNDARELRAWRRLVEDLARGLIRRYGSAEVRSWYFETWNEPDCENYWAQFSRDPGAFLAYYDATENGLHAADPALRLGGPGGMAHLSPTVRAFLAHCDRGLNRFTLQPVRCDFLSLHEKGAPPTSEEMDPDSIGILERERQYLAYLRQQHPRLAGLPLMNDECDPQVGWRDIHSWHATAFYAAWAAKTIGQHLRVFVDTGVNYPLLVNDNGFTGTWGQRTLCARLGPEPEMEPLGGLKSGPESPFSLVKKPIFNLMVLLSYLRGRRLPILGLGDPEADLGAIATAGEDGGVAMLLYNCTDRLRSSRRTRLCLKFRNLPASWMLCLHWRIAEGWGDPFRLWQILGPRQEREEASLRLLRDHQELAWLAEPHEIAIRRGRLDLPLDLPQPGVDLLLLIPDPGQAPEAPSKLSVERHISACGRPEALLHWRGGSERGLRSFVVESAGADGEWRRVNNPDLQCSAWIDLPQGPRRYRVRALDSWGRTSPPTEIVAWE